MTDDLLERATRALRETSAEPQPRSGLTRARLLDSAEQRYTSRRNVGLRWIIAIATALAASTALARVAHYWPEIKRALAPEVEHTNAAPAAKRTGARPQTAAKPLAAPQPTAAGAGALPRVEPSSAPVAAPGPVAAPAPVAEAPAEPPRRAKHSPRAKAAPASIAAPEPPPAGAAVATAPSAPPVESAELALFRRAQRLHRAHDPRALGAWDDYLRIAASGSLVPEARYNRALCLVRLGKKAEARRALAPFATGAYGNFRRTEAIQLLDELLR